MIKKTKVFIKKITSLLLKPFYKLSEFKAFFMLISSFIWGWYLLDLSKCLDFILDSSSYIYGLHLSDSPKFKSFFVFIDVLSIFYIFNVMKEIDQKVHPTIYKCLYWLAGYFTLMIIVDSVLYWVIFPKYYFILFSAIDIAFMYIVTWWSDKNEKYRHV